MNINARTPFLRLEGIVDLSPDEEFVFILRSSTARLRAWALAVGVPAALVLVAWHALGSRP